MFNSLWPAVAAVAAFFTAIFAVASFIINSKRQREIEKSSIYQKLELASIDLFKWETENRDIMIKIKQGNQDFSEENKQFIEARFYHVLNLFELCISSAIRGTLPDKVFGSWLPWIHEFANEPIFSVMWPEHKTNYIPESREIMDYAVEYSQENKFVEKICSLRKYRLKIKDWKENGSNNKKQHRKNSNVNVTVRKGEKGNIETYISIFEESKHDSYISHGEVICGRATHDLKWAEDIITQMKEEFIYYLENNEDYTIFEILSSDELIGFAIIELNKKTNVAVLADIMIKKGSQGGGIGTKALEEIETCLKNGGIGIVLLESGINNKNVHKFFEKNGYTEISVEYSKILR